MDENQYFSSQSHYFYISYINPQAPVAQKIAHEMVFRHFQGEGVEFVKSDLTDPPLSFLRCIFRKLPI